jgi:hypothetical protein
MHLCCTVNRLLCLLHTQTRAFGKKMEATAIPLPVCVKTIMQAATAKKPKVRTHIFS